MFARDDLQGHTYPPVAREPYDFSEKSAWLRLLIATVRLYDFLCKESCAAQMHLVFSDRAFLQLPPEKPDRLSLLIRPHKLH